MRWMSSNILEVNKPKWDGGLNKSLVEWMDGWIDGWMNDWLDGWKDGWMEGWMDDSKQANRYQSSASMIVVLNRLIPPHL